MEIQLIYKSFCSSGVKASFRKTLKQKLLQVTEKKRQSQYLGLRPRLFFHNHYVNLGLRPRLFFHNQNDTSDCVLDRLKVSDNYDGGSDPTNIN
jgi:hypothetical protein